MKLKMAIALALFMGILSSAAVADTIGNAGATQLQREAVSLLSAGEISTAASQQFLQRNHFDTEDVQWQRVGQVIHGPYYIPDGEEEGEGVPYVFAFNQGRSIVGLGGWLPANVLARLKATPTVRCQKMKPQHDMWMCAHQSATSKTQQTFMQEMQRLARNAG